MDYLELHAFATGTPFSKNRLFGTNYYPTHLIEMFFIIILFPASILADQVDDKPNDKSYYCQYYYQNNYWSYIVNC